MRYFISQMALFDRARHRPTTDFLHWCGYAYQGVTSDSIDIEEHDLNVLAQDKFHTELWVNLMLFGYFAFVPRSESNKAYGLRRLGFANKALQQTFKQELCSNIMAFLGTAHNAHLYAEAKPLLLAFKRDDATMLAAGLNLLVAALAPEQRAALAQSQQTLQGWLLLSLRIALHQTCSLFADGIFDVAVGDEHEVMVLQSAIAGSDTDAEERMLKLLQDLESAKHSPELTNAISNTCHKVHRFGVVYNAVHDELSVKAVAIDS